MFGQITEWNVEIIFKKDSPSKLINVFIKLRNLPYVFDNSDQLAVTTWRFSHLNIREELSSISPKTVKNQRKIKN